MRRIESGEERERAISRRLQFKLLMNINKRTELLLLAAAATAGADCGEKCVYNERHDYYYFMQSRQRESGEEQLGNWWS
jgi:hypothetical protein